MNQSYTQQDVEAAPAGHLPLVGTDIEVCVSVSGSSAVVHVNKGGILICRVKLQGAMRELRAEELMQFSTFAPDFVSRSATAGKAWSA